MRCVWLTVCAALLLLMITQETDASLTARVRHNCRRLRLIPCRGMSRGWYKLDKRRCFKLFSYFRNFDQAQVKCEQHCGDLVSLHNVHQYDRVLCHLFKYYKGKKRSVWVGGEKQRNGKFGWTDASRWNFSRWHKGQPDNWKHGEHCMEMNWNTWGLWNDQHCGAKRPFVCAVRCP
ncbi:C-type isolectin Sp-CL4-like [Genypterus blacodes]|uniref:C-type isolectin Sp-CL4-like n=1 Tax=Genypterus blacodes TaxID=154954 RepID=UPI003F762AA6